MVQSVCLRATRTTSADVGVAACSVFFKVKTGARFVWRGAGAGDSTALLVSVVSIGSMKVPLKPIIANANIYSSEIVRLLKLVRVQVLDICEYSVQRGSEQLGSVDNVCLPVEGISECEITVINQTEMAFETHGMNAGCVHQTR